MGIFKSKLSSYSGQFWPDSRISGYTLWYLNMSVIQMPQPHWRWGDKFETKKQLFNKVETISRTDTMVPSNRQLVIWKLCVRYSDCVVWSTTVLSKLASKFQAMFIYLLKALSPLVITNKKLMLIIHTRWKRG
jgi:hypothetical protein